MKELNEHQKRNTDADRLKIEDLIPTKENEINDDFAEDQSMVSEFQPTDRSLMMSSKR